MRRRGVAQSRARAVLTRSTLASSRRFRRTGASRSGASRPGSGVSEATVRARYARLCEDEIIQVTAVTNPLGLGFDAMAMVGIRTSGPPERVADEIARWDEAGYVVVTAGQFDVLVELVCEDRRHLLELTNRIRSVEGVLSTESFLYLELWKQLYDWGAGPVRSAKEGTWQ